MIGRPKTVEIAVTAALAAAPGLRMAGLYAAIPGTAPGTVKSVAYRMAKRGQLRCSAKGRNRMYFIAAPKVEPKPVILKPVVVKPKPVPIVFAKPAPVPNRPKGPAYLSGPLITTPNTIHTVYPRKPDPIRSNTFSMA